MTESTLHLGGVRRRVVEKAGQEQLEEWRTELGAGAWVRRKQAGHWGPAGYEWHVTDHLGSSTLVLGEDGQAAVGPVAGAAPERHSYDAWGQRRNAADWSEPARPPVGAEAGDGSAATSAGAKGLASSQPRGFTGHQPKPQERLR